MIDVPPMDFVRAVVIGLCFLIEGMLVAIGVGARRLSAVLPPLGVRLFLAGTIMYLLPLQYALWQAFGMPQPISMLVYPFIVGLVFTFTGLVVIYRGGRVPQPPKED